MAEVINYVEGEEEKRKMISWQENTKVSILYFREMLSLNFPTGGICITQRDVKLLNRSGDGGQGVVTIGPD